LLRVNEYFLCQSIEHLVRLDRWDASAEVINIESHRQREHPSCAGWQRVAFDAKPFAHDPAAVPTHLENVATDDAAHRLVPLAGSSSSFALSISTLP
jgi:hypothetical protein